MKWLADGREHLSLALITGLWDGSDIALCHPSLIFSLHCLGFLSPYLSLSTGWGPRVFLVVYAVTV